MLDSGSQLNVVSKNMLTFLEYKSVRSPPAISSIQGAQGIRSPIDMWIELKILLPNGTETVMIAAVVEALPTSIILGQPFLRASGSQVDSRIAVLTTAEGPIQLHERKKLPGIPKVNTVQLQEEEIDFGQSNLTPEQKKTLAQLLQSYPSVLGGKRTGKAKHVEHRIILNTKFPISDRPRQATPEQNKEAEEQIHKMLEGVIIRPSNSPYSSEVVFARKKDADGNFTSWRFCVDYRNINKHTVKDAYPIPRITDLLRSIRGSRFFVALDLRAGYWQIPIEKESVKYTAFRCALGLFEFLCMPFGLTNAPATFQRLVDFLFGDLRHRGVLVYLDDILIHGKTFDEVIGKLQIVLDRLEAEGLTVNVEKSNFFPFVLKYLGHIVKDGFLYPNPAKVSKLNDIKEPTTVNDVRSLLGMLGYYHPYIRNFNALLAPVFDLLKGKKNTKRQNKIEKVIWEEVHRTATKEAVERLKTAVLAIPTDSSEFLLEADASNDAVGAVLSCKQEDGSWAPMEFASKKLSATEKRWPIRDREAFAIIFGLKKFDPYLRGRSFTVHTDHHSLKWMLEAKEGRISRWASRLTEYDMTIFYKSSKKLEHVDYFSRFIDDAADFDVEPRMICTVNWIRATDENLPSLKKIVEAQQTTEETKGKGFYKNEGVIYYHDAIWVPPQLRTAVIAACHSVIPYRHNKVKKTSRLVRRVFNWPGLYRDISLFIASCLGCQQSRTGIERLQGLFRTHPVVGPWHTVYVDFYKCTFNKVQRLVLTMIDQSTKWAECVSIPAASLAVVLPTFVRSWVCRFGVPRVIVNDNDKTLISGLMTSLHLSLGTKNLTSTPYHPEGNATIESFHRTLNKGLASFETNEETSALSFDEALQLILYSYRLTIHLTTGETPGFLTYGIDLRPPNDNDWRFTQDVPMQQRLKFLNETRLEIQWKAYDQRLRANERKNKERTPTEFEQYQLVLVRATDYERLRMAHSTGEHKHKLTPKWSLPHRVLIVYPGKKRALVRNLISFQQRVVHIQDVRFLRVPDNKIQRDEWNQIILKSLETMYDPEFRQTKLEAFWKEVDHPDSLSAAADEGRPLKKRRIRT